MRLIIEQHCESVYRFALSLTDNVHVAEDLTQECLLRAVRGHEQLRKQSSVKPWLFQILMNLWRDRQKKLSIRLAENIECDSLEGGIRPESAVIGDEQRTRIIGFMQSLPQKQKTALFLSAAEQCSHQEIANVMGITTDSVKSNIYAARKAMRKFISMDDPVDRTRKQTRTNCRIADEP